METTMKITTRTPSDRYGGLNIFFGSFSFDSSLESPPRMIITRSSLLLPSPTSPAFGFFASCTDHSRPSLLSTKINADPYLTEQSFQEMENTAKRLPPRMFFSDGTTTPPPDTPPMASPRPLFPRTLCQHTPPI